MISQVIDLVAGDFNGTALRCRSRDNLSSIDGPLLIANRVRHRSPRRCRDPDPSRTTGEMSADFSHSSSQRFWKVST